MDTDIYASYEFANELGYSAADLNAVILPQPELGINEPVHLGSLSMLSVSTHRDKFPVTSCARVGPKGFTAGHRTIAGSLAFNTLDREAFTKLTMATRAKWNIADFMSADEYPFFDIVITCVNEAGNASYSAIYGVTILDSGMTYSLDNIILMESYSYMAKSRIPLQPAYAPNPNAIAEPTTDEMYIWTTDTTKHRRSFYQKLSGRSTPVVVEPAGGLI